LNSGFHTGKAGALRLEPHLQSIRLWLFWRWGFGSCLPGLGLNFNLPISASQVAGITGVSRGTRLKCLYVVFTSRLHVSEDSLTTLLQLKQWEQRCELDLSSDPWSCLAPLGKHRERRRPRGSGPETPAPPPPDWPRHRCSVPQAPLPHLKAWPR
jgi:hypothetical protein